MVTGSVEPVKVPQEYGMWTLAHAGVGTVFGGRAAMVTGSVEPVKGLRRGIGRARSRRSRNGDRLCRAGEGGVAAGGDNQATTCRNGDRLCRAGEGASRTASTHPCRC